MNEYIVQSVVVSQMLKIVNKWDKYCYIDVYKYKFVVPSVKIKHKHTTSKIVNMMSRVVFTTCIEYLRKLSNLSSSSMMITKMQNLRALVIKTCEINCFNTFEIVNNLRTHKKYVCFA